MDDRMLLQRIRKVSPERIDADIRAHLRAVSDNGRYHVSVYELPPDGPVVVCCQLDENPTDAQLIRAFREALLQPKSAWERE
jgi:hypothetical protein